MAVTQVRLRDRRAWKALQRAMEDAKGYDELRDRKAVREAGRAADRLGLGGEFTVAEAEGLLLAAEEKLLDGRVIAALREAVEAGHRAEAFEDARPRPGTLMDPFRAA